ncbi:hypothetical protein [Polyangium spumosum]|uniref:Uncharacterized protein n=1 Tax=Polyangium spumosum TaxID=889282 RepID=A0A6N7PVJ4_9BACT|nr:hypothetical protein [Polyangium spumosum]MRG96003.1 hypothetical protein [Polyangium spumosum]
MKRPKVKAHVERMTDGRARLLFETGAVYECSAPFDTFCSLLGVRDGVVEMDPREAPAGAQME